MGTNPSAKSHNISNTRSESPPGESEKWVIPLPLVLHRTDLEGPCVIRNIRLANLNEVEKQGGQFFIEFIFTARFPVQRCNRQVLIDCTNEPTGMAARDFDPESC